MLNFFRKSKAIGKRGEPLPEQHDGSPDSNHPSGLCPRCNKQSSFELIGSLPLTFNGNYVVSRDGQNYPDHHERASVLICRHCQQGVVVLEEEWCGDMPSIKNSGGGNIWWKGFHWWPLGGGLLHKSVPPDISDAFHEANLCLSANCPRAAAVMARRTLEAIAADKGEKSGTLAEQLSRMARNGLLHQTLADWSKEVRLVGNKGAHFDPLESVSMADAKQLVEFIRELAKYLYVLPHELNERRNGKP